MEKHKVIQSNFTFRVKRLAQINKEGLERFSTTKTG